MAEMSEADLGIVALAAQEIRELYAGGDAKMVEVCLGVVLTATGVGIKEAADKSRVFATIHEMLQREIDSERAKGARRGDAIAAIEAALYKVVFGHLP